MICLTWFVTSKGPKKILSPDELIVLLRISAEAALVCGLSKALLVRILDENMCRGLGSPLLPVCFICLKSL